MEQREDAMELLDALPSPSFCVRDNMIVKANSGAKACLVDVGTDVRSLLLTGKEEYAAFKSGCLFLTLTISGQHYSASVQRRTGFDLFQFEQDEDQSELQALALAAKELREPLTSLLTTADRLFPVSARPEDPEFREQAARMNRGLMQIQRMIANMSDANRYASTPNVRQETQDICAFLEEIFTHAAQLVAHGEHRLTFRNLPNPVYCQIEPERLERAVHNILTNAVKFTPKGGTIDACLTCRGNMLSLQIQDNGSGIAEGAKSSLHRRYQRPPALEDPAFGIGLGMVIIRTAAATHGGTVLIDQPESGGTRVTMTLAIRQNSDPQLRSKFLRVDYAGERDHGLLEFSEFLPVSLYEPK